MHQASLNIKRRPPSSGLTPWDLYRITTLPSEAQPQRETPVQTEPVFGAQPPWFNPAISQGDINKLVQTYLYTV